MPAAAAPIEMTPDFRRALRVMEETPHHLVLTGRAGTGKSTLLRHFRDTTVKRAAVLAPTGVAALNVDGQTIHAFFRFKPDVTPDTVKPLKSGKRAELYRKLQAIVIDEISMVRADLLDCVDRFLRVNGPRRHVPFGGVQMILIGDLYQIPPVVAAAEREVFAERYLTPYFFSSEAFASISPEYVELERVFRQKDGDFIELLNAIRNNTVTEAQLARLNARVDPAYEPDPGTLGICLTPTNRAADAINAARLDRLPGNASVYPGRMSGEFSRNMLPVPEDLHVKPGAQVMMANNDAEGRWVNGTLGAIHGVRRGEDGEDALLVQIAGGRVEEVFPHEWDVFRYVLDRETGRLGTEAVGAFIQYPLRLAWAVTIHKSQGKTFDRVILDLGAGVFTPGQAYVALSRCTTLEGLVLRRPLRRRDVFTDRRIVNFVTGLQYTRAEAAQPFESRRRTIERAISAGRALRLTYLKASDERSRRVVTPQELGEMSFEGKTFLGLRAHCHLRGTSRVFRLDRILDVDEVPPGVVRVEDG